MRQLKQLEFKRETAAAAAATNKNHPANESETDCLRQMDRVPYGRERCEDSSPLSGRHTVAARTRVTRRSRHRDGGR